MQTKNTRFSTKIFPFFCALIYLGASINCGSSSSDKSRLIRILDRIDKKNIIHSPLRNIIEKFNFVEENFTGKWVYLPDLSSPDQEIWAISSDHPILGNHDSDFPEGIKLLKDGQELEYLSGAEQRIGWRWIGTSETLDLRGFEGYDKTRRGIVLNGENSFQFEKLLPKGNLILDLYLVNSNWQKEQVKVTVSFDDSREQELVVTRKKYFRIRKKLSLGRYKIEIKLSPRSDERKDPVTPVVLGQVKITGNQDIILLTHPRQEEREIPQGEYRFQYNTYVALQDKDVEAVKPEVLYLYNIRNKFLLNDSGIESNPFSIKKKITFDENAFNCLMAPPESEYRLDLNIPADASFFLEFGYGILNEFRKRESNRPIGFRVLLEHGDEEVLFSKTIDWATTKDILWEKIDMTPYSGEKVRLTFSTQEIQLEMEDSNAPTVIPVWVNPLIYRMPEEKPNNIILISLDTVRPDHLGCYGYGRNTSPAIDLLAEDSVLFENAYSTTSWTLPGHVSLLTSLNCLNHQVYFPLQKMDTEATTLADILRTRQYYCAAFTGGGYLSETYGFSKGFDSYQEIKLHGDQAIRLDEAERLARLATQWLEENKDKNFFLFLHTYQPHDPYANLSPIGKEFLAKDAEWDQVKAGTLMDDMGGRFQAQFSERERQNIISLYDGEIKYTDVSFVKPIMDKLKELGLYEKSLIILTSDHGEEFMDHEAWLHDHSVYNEGIRIPLMVKFPEAENKGTRIENIVRITDIMPTILDRANIKTKKYRFDGATLIPMIKGNEKIRRTFLSDLALREFTMAPSVISLNKGQYKFILNKKISSPYVQRLVRNFDGKLVELYDLENDPGEIKNLAANIAYRDICFEFLDEIERMYEKADKIKKDRDEVTLDQSLRERLKALGYIK